MNKFSLILYFTIIYMIVASDDEMYGNYMKFFLNMYYYN